MKTKFSSPDQLLDGISDFIAKHQDLLRQGALADMAGLDRQVQELCRAVGDMAAEDQARYAGRMQQLFAELQALGDSLAAARDALAQEMQGISAHHKASVAYRTAYGGKKPDEK